jgi:hypothetical protein
VKERCAEIVSREMLAIGSADQIKLNVEKQLSQYNYTFPVAPGLIVRVFFSGINTLTNVVRAL